MKVTKFLGIEWNEKRMNCVLKRNEARNHRRKARYENDRFDMKSKKFIASKTNSCFPNETAKWNIYDKKHFIWINSAIRKVKNELEKRGIDSSFLSNYIIRKWSIYICPEK